LLIFTRIESGAARSNNLRKVNELLVEKKHNPNAMDSSGYVALHYAARQNNLDVMKVTPSFSIPHFPIFMEFLVGFDRARR